MLYNIHINQYAVIENNWETLELKHIAVFNAMHQIFTTFRGIQSIEDSMGKWFWLDYNLVLQELPLLKIKKDALRDLIRELSKYDLIEANPNNQNLGRTYFRMGKNACLFFAVPERSTTDPSVVHYTPPLESTTDNNNTKDNNTNIIKENKKEKVSLVEENIKKWNEFNPSLEELNEIFTLRVSKGRYKDQNVTFNSNQITTIFSDCKEWWINVGVVKSKNKFVESNPKSAFTNWVKGQFLYPEKEQDSKQSAKEQEDYYRGSIERERRIRLGLPLED